MAYVITRLCRDCIDSACVEVCPVSDCIVEHKPAEGARSRRTSRSTRSQRRAQRSLSRR
jgi:Fe-S-cluster-containing dehydrogenase component